jgi:Xaa-Pro aminopeptidase
MGDKVGFEESYVSYESYKKMFKTYKVNLIETEGIIEKQRVVKDEEEIEYIKKACEITDNAFEYIIRNIHKGMTEKEVAFEIERYMLQHGGDGLAFDLIVAFGENTSMPHAVPTDRVINSGDIIQFDIGAKYKGYCSDFSRVVFVEELNPSLKDAYLFVKEQQKLLAENLKDGANIKEVIKERDLDFEKEKYDIYHAFGHGVGLEIHEDPVLRDNVDTILKEKTVIAIEPGVYDPGRFGIRIEDTFLVGKNGSEPLTNYSKDFKIIHLK